MWPRRSWRAKRRSGETAAAANNLRLQRGKCAVTNTAKDRPRHAVERVIRVGVPCDQRRASRFFAPDSTPVRLADEAAAVPGRLRRPSAGDAPAEQRWTEHGALEPGAPVDVAAGHAGDLAGGIEPGDRLEVLVEYAAFEVGLDAAEVLARQRKDLHCVEGRRVERLRRLQRLAEFRLAREPLRASLVVALDGGEERWRVDLHLSRQLGQRVGLADERRVVEQLHD